METKDVYCIIRVSLDELTTAIENIPEDDVIDNMLGDEGDLINVNALARAVISPSGMLETILREHGVASSCRNISKDMAEKLEAWFLNQ